MGTYDVCVIGAGLAGAATARELTGRGHSVLLLEQYAVGHALGSSHGSSRIYRRAYGDAFYVALTGRAADEWDRLEAESGVALRTPTGGLDVGGDRPIAIHAALTAHGVPVELLTADEVTERWPGMTVGPAAFHPDAGHVDADRTVARTARPGRRRRSRDPRAHAGGAARTRRGRRARALRARHRPRPGRRGGGRGLASRAARRHWVSPPRCRHCRSSSRRSSITATAIRRPSGRRWWPRARWSSTRSGPAATAARRRRTRSGSSTASRPRAPRPATASIDDRARRAPGRTWSAAFPASTRSRSPR